MVSSPGLTGRSSNHRATFETLSQSWWLLDAPLEAGHDTHSIQLFSAASLAGLIQAHHLKGGAAEWAVGIVQRLADLEMIVVLGDDEPDGFARGLEGGGKLPGLALEFRRFQGAVQHRHRAGDAVEMTLRAERIFGGIGEL